MKINPRILIVDDNEAVHTSLQSILQTQPVSDRHKRFSALDQELFSQDKTEQASNTTICVELDSAYHGEQAFNMVTQAESNNQPYTLIFMDVRMPPGQDGIQTIHKIWQDFPQINIILTTAYSDYHWDDIIAILGYSDCLLFMHKPFEPIEVKQSVTMLTAKYKAQCALQKYTHELESTVNKLNYENKERKRAEIELTMSRDQALEANRTKNHFLSIMSHELRTPLNIILNYSELLEEDISHEIFEKKSYLQGIQAIYTSGKHLCSVLNDVLSLSVIEAGKVELHHESFDIYDHLNTLKSIFQVFAEKNNNQLQYQCPENIGNIVTDKTRLYQILLNIVNNACKFTKNGLITLQISKTMENNKKYIFFVVTDTGIGISPAHLNKIFTSFYQVDNSATRHYEGTGLGLSICQRFCQILGGTIEVNSELGHGTCFTVKLPNQ